MTDQPIYSEESVPVTIFLPAPQADRKGPKDRKEVTRTRRTGLFLNFGHFLGLDQFCGKQKVWLLYLGNPLRK